MKKRKIFHLCLPNEDNIGDTLAYVAVSNDLLAMDKSLDFNRVDIWGLRKNKTFLDARIDEINRGYQMLVIGAGGLLSLDLLNYVFSDPSLWQQIQIPIVFYGVGIIRKYFDSHLVMIDRDMAHLNSAFQQASLISVRDLKSLLLTVKSGCLNKTYLTGCPTLPYAMGRTSEKQYDVGLNLPFQHGYGLAFVQELSKVAKTVTKHQSLLWLCHSNIEKTNALEFREQFKLNFDIAMMNNFDDVKKYYPLCRKALVTKAHAAMFSLANEVPFAFIGYDIKCDALLDMIYGNPTDFIVHIDELKNIQIEKRIDSMLKCIDNGIDDISESLSSLNKMFSQERKRFFSDFISLLQ